MLKASDFKSLTGTHLINCVRQHKGQLFESVQHILQTHGNVCQWSIGSQEYILANNHDVVNHTLVKYDRHFSKTEHHKPLERFLGKGLVTAEGSIWQKHRRIIQPYFKKRMFTDFIKSHERQIFEKMQLLQAHIAESSQPYSLNLVEYIHHLVLEMMATVLFGPEVSKHTQAMSEAVNQFLNHTSNGSLFPSFNPMNHLKLHRKKIAIDQIIFEIIANKKSTYLTNDFISHLIRAQRAAPLGFTDEEIRDEMLTMLLAGHETTANVLIWALVELAKNPELIKRIRDAHELCHDNWKYQDIAKCGLLHQVFKETMRLYPPGWLLARTCLKDHKMGDIHIKEKTQIILPVWFIHRNHHYWDHAHHFDPDRFDTDPLHQFFVGSYLPFSLGSRSCIGQQLAKVQASLILGHIITKFDWRISGDPRPQFQVLLRPPKKIVAHISKQKANNYPINEDVASLYQHH